MVTRRLGTRTVQYFQGIGAVIMIAIALVLLVAQVITGLDYLLVTFEAFHKVERAFLQELLIVGLRQIHFLLVLV